MNAKKSKDKERDGIVIIKAQAYYKMLLHVLRFGNKARDPRTYREVMGMLIGYLEGEKLIKNVIIEDAVPISHGGSIEVDFSPQDYVSFAQVDAEFAEKNWFTVGWYHSHPGLSIFFSGTDINNQLGWQTPNPNAIGLVFDHTYLETPGDLGFRAFRLDDPSKGARSNYHEVQTIVEPPNSIEYYFKIMDLINSVHFKEPQILELNETPDPFGEIIFPKQSDLLLKKPEFDVSYIMSTLQHNLSNLLLLSLEPIIKYLNFWSGQVIDRVNKNNIHMRENLMNLKDYLSLNFNKMQNDFKFSLLNNINEVEAYIDDKFELFDKDYQDIKTKINELKGTLINELELFFSEKINNNVNNILKNFENTSNDLAEINKIIFNNTENLLEQNTKAEKITSVIENVELSSLNEIQGIKEKLETSFSEKIHKLSLTLSHIKNLSSGIYSNLESSSNELKQSKDIIQNKIKQLDKEKKDLLNEIKKLKT